MSIEKIADSVRIKKPQPSHAERLQSYKARMSVLAEENRLHPLGQPELLRRMRDIYDESFPAKNT
jgi:hypothetical protein